MRIALIGEGTYPFQFGGVSVWCDQLVRGMSDYEFDLVGLVATGDEPVVWEVPDNVSSVTAVPLWEPESLPSVRHRMSGPMRRHVRKLLAVLLAPPDTRGSDLRDSLRALHRLARHEDLGAALRSEEAMAMLSALWRRRSSQANGHVEPTLHDAVTAMQLLEHALRPLSRPAIEADVVHTVTNGVASLPAITAKWDHGTPMLLTEHGVAIREQYLHHRRGPFRFPVKALYLAFLRRLCSLSYLEAATISPGNVFNVRWERRLGADTSRVRTVYNGVDPREFPIVDDEPAVPTISWAGRIDPVKDVETLLHAFAIVRESVPDARLRLFGSAPRGCEPYLERCVELARRLGIADATSFEGRVDDIRDAYVAGHVVVLCSVAEGFPYTVIEAMTCGRACVGTDVGGVTEAIGDVGEVVPPRNPAALAAACVGLLQDDERRRRLGSAARLRALEFFTVDRAITAYDEMYSLLAAGHSLPGRADRGRHEVDVHAAIGAALPGSPVGLLDAASRRVAEASA